MMTFLEIKSEFEAIIDQRADYELLEFNYAPYSFGSGFAAYKINAKNLKLVFDGKDELVTLLITSKNIKYPSNQESEIFSGSYSELLKNLTEILEGKL